MIDTRRPRNNKTKRVIKSKNNFFFSCFTVLHFLARTGNLLYFDFKKINQKYFMSSFLILYA